MGLKKPVKDSISLPTLSNPAAAENIQSGYEAINVSGEKVTGSHVCPEANVSTGELTVSSSSATISFETGFNPSYVFGICRSNTDSASDCVAFLFKNGTLYQQYNWGETTEFNTGSLTYSNGVVTVTCAQFGMGKIYWWVAVE